MKPRKQVIVVVSVILLMATLLSMNIKGLVKPKEPRSNPGSVTEATSSLPVITVAGVSELAKQEISEGIRSKITTLEEALTSGTDAQKLETQKKLASSWDDMNKPAPAALYYEMVALRENTYQSWLKTGDTFTDAYQNSQDSLTQPALAEKAISSYKKALIKQPGALEATAGLGIAYVSSSTDPMQGIRLLKEVTTKDPGNVKANMNLGLFSMKTGQFEKAVERFKTVLGVQPGPEAWFYLASSYENLGKKTEAIAAYQKSKELAADPGLSRFVDQKIGELSN